MSNYEPALPIDARILWILVKFEPGDVLALPASQILRKFEIGDVLATSDAKTSPGSNFPRFPKPKCKAMEEQLYHVLMHEPSIASVPNCALASSIEQSHSCC